VHPESSKVLPYPGEAKLEIAKSREGWFEAVIKTPASAAEGNQTTDTKNSTPGTLADLGILEKLIALLAERKKELPEGSYTTHLFSSGPDKIRKKTGEEAVELILARDQDEIVSEAADLVYHMMVLFAALDIPFNEVLAELTKRHK
jgi:phosphoribosyl-AMP cyclohydrolase / phosphoribosyl-ATP pyrophosphohydrolase